MRTTAYSGEDVVPITHAEAMALVQSREQAHERALDRKEAELLGAQIQSTAVADLGYQKVILNRVPMEKALPVEEGVHSNEDQIDFSLFVETEDRKIRTNVTLSGTVRDGISELWWRYKGHHFKIFTNANFLWFNPIEGSVEDETRIFSIFPLIIKGHPTPDFLKKPDEWYPSHADFSEDQLEYYLIQYSGIDEIDAEAERFIVLMLEYYRDNLTEMRIGYENAEKLRLARKAYRKANPRKERDVIINSAPIDKSSL